VIAAPSYARQHGERFGHDSYRLKRVVLHLGTKMPQPIENKARGRPAIVVDDLLHYECRWIFDLSGMRDGTFNPEAEIPASGYFIKASGQPRESIHISVPGRLSHTVQQPKLSTTPKENQEWKDRTKLEEARFQEAINTRFTTAVYIPDERNYWDALKRARTASAVRRICSLSKIWLKPRREFPNGGFAEYWPYRSVLYKCAEQFCRAKLDSRYPARDQRETGDYRRIEYLARGLAGLTLGRAASTGVELLRKLQHFEQCTCWRCMLGIAPRFPKSLSEYLSEIRPPADAFL
jgi:hypothetical protein